MAAPSDRCEVVFTDSQSAVLRADALTGRPAVLTRDHNLMQPFGIAVGQNGEFFISDTGCLSILGINPITGEQRVISRGGILGLPFGIAVERSGMILVANAQALLRVDPETGAQTIVSSHGLFRAPIGVTVAENGDIFVVDALGPVIRVEPTSGAQTLISSGGYLKRPQGIAVKGADVYVTDVATADMNFGVGRVVRVHIHTGKQFVLSEGGYLVGPVGIAVEPNGHLIVGDPYTINPQSADLFDGGIIRIDKVTGAQKLVARGAQSFVNPRGVAVIPHDGPSGERQWSFIAAVARQRLQRSTLSSARRATRGPVPNRIHPGAQVRSCLQAVGCNELSRRHNWHSRVRQQSL